MKDHLPRKVIPIFIFGVDILNIISVKSYGCHLNSFFFPMKCVYSIFTRPGVTPEKHFIQYYPAFRITTQPKLNLLLSGTNSMAELDACPMLQRGTCTSALVIYKALPHTCTAHLHYNLYSTSTAIKGLPSCQATTR